MLGELSLTVDLGSPGADTSIGQSTHPNNPIGGGTGISAVSLKFTTKVYVDGNFLQDVTFIYDFNHRETPNGANPCANGQSSSAPINKNGCADRVQVNFNSQSDGFQIGNYVHALDIMGFMDNNNQMTEFWTMKEKNNKARIIGRVALYETLVSGIPEPASWAMPAAGFGLVGVASRRRRSATGRAAA